MVFKVILANKSFTESVWYTVPVKKKQHIPRFAEDTWLFFSEKKKTGKFLFSFNYFAFHSFRFLGETSRNFTATADIFR